MEEAGIARGPWWKEGGGRMVVCQAARLCRKLPTRGVGPAVLQRMREEEAKEEEGGIVNPSRPWVRWPICLNEKEAGYWGGFKSLSER